MSELADTRSRPAMMSLRVHNPVLVTLTLAGFAAVLVGGFVTLAPNRLVSGRPVALWAATPAVATAAMAVLGAGLFVAALAPPRRRRHAAAAIAATALYFVVLLALGAAASRLSAAAPPAARTAPGAAFWIVAVGAVLALADALQRLGAGPLLRLGVFAAVTLGSFMLALLGRFDALSLAHEFATERRVFAAALGRHVMLVAAAVGPALLLGFPLGIAIAGAPRRQGPVFAALNALQTVPSIALFGLLLGPLSTLAKTAPALGALGIAGVGPAPAIIALVLYALLPVVRGTVAGLSQVDPTIVDAARGMGMTRHQILWRVELPLALPVLLAGLRIVVVQTIGLAVVAALIGAGGLGTFVFQGLGEYAVDLVLLGALPAVFLAFAADFVLATAADWLRRRTP